MNPLQQSYQKYLRHQKGLALLWFWMEQWKDLNGWKWLNNSELHLSELSSQRFAVGSPLPGRGVRSSNAFLGMQSDEASWLKRIEWSKAVWDKEQQRLWLVSVTQKSPDLAWPDLPPVAVGIVVDCMEHMGKWNGPRLDTRGIWWDENGGFHVDSAPSTTLGVKVGDLAQWWSTKERQSVESLRDIVLSRLDNSNVWLDPGFYGESAQVSSEYANFVNPFEKPKESAPIEFNYPEIFGQFLEEQPVKKK